MESSGPRTPETQNLSKGEQFSLDLNSINTTIEAMLQDVSVDQKDVQGAWIVRAILIENYIDSLEPTFDNLDPRSTAQLEFMIDKARIFERAGNQLRYLEELDAIETFGYNLRLDHLVADFTEEINAKTAELGNSPEELIIKLRRYINFANREYLRDMLQEGLDYEDFLGAAYGMILSEGEDPDEVFRLLGIIE